MKSKLSSALNIAIPLLILFAVSTSCKKTRAYDSASPRNPGSEPASLKLCRENSRYLEYEGEPLILITSAEHYGAVLNLDFDYHLYLETLKREGFNYTRIFSGTYIEPVNNIFGIARNTLAPDKGRYISPWNKEEDLYDLDSFNPDFFIRLKDFVSQAEQRGIIVEITLFTSIYAEDSWKLSPLNPVNNLNVDGTLDYHRLNTLHNGLLWKYQEKYIRKVVSELNEFDNVFFEIQNEPWSDNPNLADYVNLEDDQEFTRSWQKKVEAANTVSLEWQAWVASVIRDEESALSSTHLIAQNISNFQYDLVALPEHISIINFHYALPPAAYENLDLGGVVGLDETGFMPHKNKHYIHQAWKFILSGGGLYNNLDYSFTVGNEQGNWPIPETNPGWGGGEFRKLLSYLAETMKQVPFYKMEFADDIVHTENEKVNQYGLFQAGSVYLIYLEDIRNKALIPRVPASTYQITWLDMMSGMKQNEEIQLGNGASISSPFAENSVVLLIETK